MSGLFIDGLWQEAASGDVREIRCPADGTLVATVPEAGPEDSELAIAAARRAFDEGPWPSTSSLDRGALLHRVADLLERDKDEVARLESLDTGKRLVESEYDVDDIVGVFRFFAGLAGAESGRVVDTGRPNVVSRVVHEPVGVCSLITPWNYPLLQTAWKVAPAIAAGNTFVLKPSELTPSTAIWLMRALTEAGLPAGVANLILGAPSGVTTPGRRTDALTSARVVVGAGRGAGSADGFADLLELTDILGGALGVSRVVTSLGWRPHHEQVGQTGSRISPDLYVACGISGAIQHWAGCQSAKTILAINTDADAPMVTKAHYAVIGDLHEVVPAINEELKRRLA